MHSRRGNLRGQRLLGALALTLQLAGCTGGTAGPDDLFDDPNLLACPALTASVSSAQPLDRVSLGQLPLGLFDPIGAEVRADGVTEPALTFVERAADGSAAMVAPLHPSGSATGGAVTVTVTDGVRSCPSFSFVIEALPAAPGETEGIVDALQELVAIRAELAGTTVSELMAADGTGLPQYLIPLATLQSVVHHPDNPNSLRAIADGTAPIGAGADLDMADRVLARTGLRSVLEEQLDSARAAVAALPAHRAPGPHRAETVATCLTDPIELPGQLHECMSLANSAAFNLRESAATNQVLDDIGFATGVAGLVPHPGVRLASAAAGLATWSVQKYKEGTASLLPSDFASIEVIAAPTEFMEDEEGSGDWQAEVTATSKGWRLDQVALEVLLQIAGGNGAYAEWMERLLPPSVRDGLLGLILTTVVQEAIDVSGGPGGTGFIEIEPESFGPVDVSGQEYSERTVVGDAFEFVDHTEYEPRRPGETTVTVRTRGGLFGFQQITASQPILLTVRQIGLRFLEASPYGVSTASVDIPLNLIVENSAHPEMVVIEPGTPTDGSATISYVGDGVHAVTYTTPPDLGLLPDLLAVRHVAATGARADADEGRTANIEFRYGRIVISPRSGCVQAHGTLQFSAEVIGLANQNVRWSADVGSIDESTGLYTPPPGAQPGTPVTITATSIADPSLIDTVNITAGCVCTFSLAVGDFSYTAVAGDAARFRTLETEPYFGSLWSIDVFRTGDLEYPQYENSAILGIDPRDAGLLGEVRTGGSGDFGLQGSEILFQTIPPDEENPGAEVVTNLRRPDENTLIADALGEVIYTDGISRRRAAFSASIHIALPPGYTPIMPVPEVSEYVCTVAPTGGT